MKLQSGLITGCLLILPFAGLDAAGPRMLSAEYNPNSNVLTIHLDSQARTDNVLFSRLSFDDDGGGLNDDLIFQGGTVLNQADSLADNLVISLLFEGVIDNRLVSLYGKDVTVAFWGVDPGNADQLESMNLADIVLIADDHAFVDANGHTSVNHSVGVTVLAAEPMATISGAHYDANINRLSLYFDRDIQFDQIAEDRTIQGGPGNDFLDPEIPGQDPGEDVNGNTALDKEANINIFKVSVADAAGNTVPLEGIQAIDQIEDNDTLGIYLTISNSKKIETSLDATSLSVNIQAFAFRDTLYNPNAAGQVAITVIPDSLPLIVDSVQYDLGINELIVFFRSKLPGNRELDLSSIPPVITKFSFRVGENTINLNGVRGSIIVESQYHLKLKKPLLSDQEALELLIATMTTGDTLYFSLGEYAVFDINGNGNLAANDIPVVIVDPDTPSLQPPKLVRSGIRYEAGSNFLVLEWDQRIGGYNYENLPNSEPDDFHDLVGVNIYDTVGQELITLSRGKVYYLGNRNETIIQLSELDEITLERHVNKTALSVTVDPFTFFVFGKENGNLSAPVDSGFMVNYLPDTTVAGITAARYNDESQSLGMDWDKPIDFASLDLSKLSLGGVSLAGDIVGGDTLFSGSSLEIVLSTAAITAIENLPDSIKTNPVLAISAGAFTNNDGTLATDSTIVASFGREFWIKNAAAFANPSHFLEFASIRMVGDLCDIYVVDDVWDDLITLADIDSVRIAFEEGLMLDSLLAPSISSVINGFTVAPELAEGEKIILCFVDIKDEYDLGRNDTNDNLFVHGYNTVTDTSLVFSNRGKIIYLDVNPQMLTSDDFSGTTLHALVQEYTKLIYRLQGDEPAWLVEGLGYMFQKLALGKVVFFGDGTEPKSTAANELTFVSGSLKNRSDNWNPFLFLSYLAEKYSNTASDSGGWDVIQAIVASDSSGIDAISDALAQLGSSDDAADAFINYATASFLDLYQIDTLYNGLYNFNAIDLTGPVSGKNADVLQWNSAAGKGAPYSLSSIQPWSFKFYASRAYFIDIEGQMILVSPDLEAADDIIFDGYDGISYRAKKILLKSGFLNLVSSDFEVVDFDIDPVSGQGILPMTTDPGFTFRDTTANGPETGTQILVLIVAKTDIAQPPVTHDFVISNITSAPEYSGFYAFQNAALPSYLDLIVSSSRGVYDEFGMEGPTIKISGGDQERSLLLERNEEHGTAVIIYRGSHAFDSDGVYTLIYVGHDLSGNLLSNVTLEVTVGAIGAATKRIVSASGTAVLNIAESAQLPSSISMVIESNSVITGELPAGVTALGKTFRFDPANLGLTSLGMIRLEIPAGSSGQPEELGIYLKVSGGGWRYLESVKGQDGFMEARTPSLGTFVLAKGNHSDPLTEYSPLVTSYALSFNYPNPFNPTTSIDYAIATAGRVTVKVYNLLGQEVATLVDSYREIGWHSTSWQGIDRTGQPAPSGIYFYRLSTGEYHATRKMVLLK